MLKKLFMKEKPNVEQATRDAQQEFTNIIKAWHERYELDQRKIESEFNFDDVEFWSVNVWDEIDHLDNTFMYVEMCQVPAKECFSVLNHLWHYLRERGVSNVSFRFYDSASIYPRSLLTESGRQSSFKRWELLLENVTPGSLDSIVELLKKAPDFNGKKIDVYCES